MSKYANTLAARSAARVPTYNMTAEQLEQMREAARRDGLRAGIYACNAMYSVALLQALRDGLGFGKNRLKAAFERVQMLFGQIVAGEISYEDMAAALQDECGIRLTVERPEGTPVDAMELFAKMRPKGYAVRIR